MVEKEEEKGCCARRAAAAADRSEGRSAYWHRKRAQDCMQGREGLASGGAWRMFLRVSARWLTRCCCAASFWQSCRGLAA